MERWSRDQWNHRLDSLFLKCKDQLDRASCRFLRVREKRIASELYYRIKAGETTFATAANEFSEGPERNSGGFIPLQPLKSTIWNRTTSSTPGDREIKSAATTWERILSRRVSRIQTQLSERRYRTLLLGTIEALGRFRD